MREIEFRGKQTSNGKWIYGLLTTYWAITKIRIKPETVSQYTGLHDKYGSQIFEGDIIKSDMFHIDNPLVTFNNGCFCIDEELRLIPEAAEAVEVIGNIYDNPELLETAKNSAEITVRSKNYE